MKLDIPFSYLKVLLSFNNFIESSAQSCFYSAGKNIFIGSFLLLGRLEFFFEILSFTTFLSDSMLILVFSFFDIFWLL